MKKKSKKGIDKKTTCTQNHAVLAPVTLERAMRHADNYGIEIVGLDELAETVLSGELLLIMEHLKNEIVADNYGE